MGLVYLSPGLSRGEQREESDASAVHPQLGVAHLADELDPSSAGSWRPCPVLDSAPSDAAEVAVVDRRAVGDEQLDGGVVDVERDLDLAGLELGEQKVEHDDAA
jgi:hypothetical protein